MLKSDGIGLSPGPSRAFPHGIYDLAHNTGFVNVEMDHETGVLAPVRAIQELAGHRDLMTTQRYMHLSPASVEAAIRLLEGGVSSRTIGDIVETGVARSATVWPDRS